MMKLQGLIVTTKGLSGDRRSTFGFDALPFVGVVFFLVPPLWELCCSLVLLIDGIGLGNIFGGGGMLIENIFKSRFLHYTCPLFFSSYASFHLSPSPSFSLSHSPSFSPSPSFSFSRSHSLSLSLSYGFCLDWVLADVKNDLADCSFLRCRERLY